MTLSFSKLYFSKLALINYVFENNIFSRLHFNAPYLIFNIVIPKAWSISLIGYWS